MINSIEPPADVDPLEIRGHRTYHLVPAPSWQDQQAGDHYIPERFDEEGFIHCTDTIDEVIAVGNRYYQSDPRPFVLLEIECDAVSARIVYEDARHIFPHIYGALERSAVRRVEPVERDDDGRFLAVPGIGG